MPNNTCKYYHWGCVAAEDSPIIMNRDLSLEHTHFSGNSGAGKTSMRLTSLLDQTIGFGDTSLIFIDLKGEKLENLADVFRQKKSLKFDVVVSKLRPTENENVE